jgi:hypothetical protein
MTPGRYTIMADLARAIVDLAQAAEGRRGARRQLNQATDAVARSIRSLLRSGDSVTIPSWASEEQSARRPSARAKPPVTYTALQVRYRAQDGSRPVADVLIRDRAVLEDIPGASLEVHSTTAHPGLLPPIHLATAEEREAFIGEVEVVVAAFRGKLELDAKRYLSLAEQATKQVPR